jgi:hypothetical protein
MVTIWVARVMGWLVPRAGSLRVRRAGADRGTRGLTSAGLWLLLVATRGSCSAGCRCLLCGALWNEVPIAYASP